MDLIVVIAFTIAAIYAATKESTYSIHVELWVLVDYSGRIYYTGSEDDVRTIRLNYKNKDELYAVLLTGNTNGR